MQKSARILGQELGLTAPEMNVLLKSEGFLEGQPGRYSVTAKGEPFAHEQDFHSGPGGYPWYNRDWSTRSWDESILKTLNVTDQKKRDAQDAAASMRRAARAQRSADYQARPELPQQPPASPTGNGTGSLPPAVVILLVLAGAIVVVAGSWWVVTKVKNSRERRNRPTEPTQGSSS